MIKMKTLRYLSIFALAAVVYSCGTQSNKSEYACVAPLPAGISVDSLQDCMVPAQFTPADFNWEDNTLSMTVYNLDLYDAVDLSKLQKGDTIIYCGDPIVVDSVVETNGGIDINGGEVENGGCCLVPNGGGTYRTLGMDDHASYTKLGKATLPLAENFIIIDCGENPDDPSDTIRVDQKQYIESIKDSRPSFFDLNTTVTIEKGKVTEINRRWIP